MKKRNMFKSSNSTSLIFLLDLPTISTPLLLFDDNITFLIDQTIIKYSNISCQHRKYEYISQIPLFNIVRYITHNLNRFFILPAIILNLCAFYILRRTRMNRSSSIAFYMQTLALCDVAFFALRVIFGELSSISAHKHILTTGLCKFLFLMVNAVNYTTGKVFSFHTRNEFDSTPFSSIKMLISSNGRGEGRGGEIFSVCS